MRKLSLSKVSQVAGSAGIRFFLSNFNNTNFISLIFNILQLIFIDVELIYNVELVSDVYQSESVIHKHISILF